MRFAPHHPSILFTRALRYKLLEPLTKALQGRHPPIPWSVTTQLTGQNIICAAWDLCSGNHRLAPPVSQSPIETVAMSPHLTSDPFHPKCVTPSTHVLLIEVDQCPRILKLPAVLRSHSVSSCIIRRQELGERQLHILLTFVNL